MAGGGVAELAEGLGVGVEEEGEEWILLGMVEKSRVFFAKLPRSLC